jgi:hypothetical protein
MCWGDSFAQEILHASLSLRWLTFPDYTTTHNNQRKDRAIVQIEGGI